MTSSLLAVAMAVGLGQDQGLETEFSAFVKIVEGLRGKGLPDVSEAPFQLFQGMPPVSVKFSGYLPTQRGWVFPAGEDGFRLGVEPAMGFVEVNNVLGDAEIAEYQIGGGFTAFGGNYPTELICALLVIAGEEERAKATYKTYFLNRMPSVESLVTPLYASARSAAVTAFCQQRFDSTLHFVDLMKIEEKAGASGLEPGGGDVLVADIQRRRASTLPSVDTVLSLSGQARYEGMIQVLENFGAVEDNGYLSLWNVAEAIVAEGEGIVPTLIDAVGEDDRLTFQRRNIVWGGGYQPSSLDGLNTVSDVCYQLLQRTWIGMPFGPLPSDASFETRKAFAIKMKAEWSVVKDIAVADRHFRNVLNPGVSEAVALNSLTQLLTPSSIEGGAEYKPGQILVLADDLSQEERDQLAKTVEARLLASFGTGRDSRRSSAPPSAYALLLSRLEGKNSIPILRRYTANLLSEMAGKQPGSRWGSEGKDLADVVAQRLALGDNEALVDYRKFVGDFKEADLRAEYLRPAAELPNNQAVQKLTREILALHDQYRVRDEARNRFRRDPFVFSGSDMWILNSPAVRDWAVQWMKNSELVATATARDQESSSIYDVVFNEQRRSTLHVDNRTYAKKDYPDPVPVTYGDFLAATLADRLSLNEFALIEPQSVIKAEKAELFRFLTRRDFDLSESPHFRSYRPPREAIYFPGREVGLVPDGG